MACRGRSDLKTIRLGAPACEHSRLDRKLRPTLPFGILGTYKHPAGGQMRSTSRMSDEARYNPGRVPSSDLVRSRLGAGLTNPGSPPHHLRNLSSTASRKSSLKIVRDRAAPWFCHIPDRATSFRSIGLWIVRVATFSGHALLSILPA